MNKDSNPVQRVVGFDSHPDSFTAALIRGNTPAAAQVEKVFNKIPLSQLESWAKKYTTPNDLIVLEASGNSFHVVRLLQEIGRPAKVLESCHIGKLKEAHANTDKLSAIRIGKAFLSGTAKEVWVPDLKTQERRDWFHADEKAVKRTTQLRNRISSYLSDNGIRVKVPKTIKAPGIPGVIREAVKNWHPRQLRVLEGFFMELRHAEEQRQHWGALIAQEVISDPTLLSLVQVCGIRQKIAFALGAIVGDIKRFPRPGSLVKFAGLNPAMDDSGKNEWHGGIGGHGRKDLRVLLIEAAQALIKSDHSIGKWGRKLFARKSSLTLAVAAVARKLIVAVWYQMMGKWTQLQEIDSRLSLKIGKIISAAGPRMLQDMKITRPELRKRMEETLLGQKVSPPEPEKKPTSKIRTYVLDPDKKMQPKEHPRIRTGLRAEYGIG